MVTKGRLGLLYVGKKGGGASLFQDLSAELSEDCDLVLIQAIDSQVEFGSNSSDPIFVNSPHNRRELVAFLFRLDRLIRLVLKIHASSISHLVVVMPQPIDLIVCRLLKMLGVKISYVIHDHKRHPGDWWPFARSVNKRIAISDHIFFLSSHTRTKASKNTKIKSSSVHILEAKFLGSGVYPPMQLALDFGRNYYLIVGRMRKYKGVNLVLEAWSVANVVDSKLLIAGEGAGNLLGKVEGQRSVEILDKWLTMDELWSLINNAQAVVLPYIEASQSGICAMAIAAGVPILATNVGGLPEQLALVENVVIVEPNTYSLAKGLELVGTFQRTNRTSRQKMQLTAAIIAWHEGRIGKQE